MTSETDLDVAFCRSHFPALNGEWVFLENAGGTLAPRQVIDRATDYLTYNLMQPGEGYAASTDAAARVEEGRTALAALINADADEIVVGPSTTSNVYVLSQALRPLLAAGDEVIVTNQDHEANNGAWRQLEGRGVVVKEWRMNAESDDLEAEDLDALLTARTKLVCFTHCSNIVGLIHDVKSLVRKIHDAGALACVDGVAYTPHRRVDVKDLDVDFYLYSSYKVFGPHMGILYGKREHLPLLASQSHYFLAKDDFQRRLCPGGYNYELTAAAGGIVDYLDAVHSHHFPGTNVPTSDRIDQVFGMFSRHENKMAQRIKDCLNSKPAVRLAGRGASPDRERVGVFSFTVEGRDSLEVAKSLHAKKLGLYADDFYAARCIDALGARPQNGVVRASLVHYNASEDVDRLIDGLDQIL